MRVAVVTGITGQDGSYLAELLLSKGYSVYGLVRRSSNSNVERIESVIQHPNLTLVEGDMGDTTSILNLLLKLRDAERIEIYNLAAQSQVHTSFTQPEYTAEVNALGPLRFLEAVRQLGIADKTRFYQASTSELYGKVVEIPQKETTPFYPRSPYGVAKLYGFWIVKNYRESYGMFACNGILFNHESERRGPDFVSRKITLGLEKIYTDPKFTLELGNLNAKRDWGHAKDYVHAMWLMLQHETPDDYVIASEETHTIREFIEIAFRSAGHSLTWEGEGLDEVGRDESGRAVIRINSQFYRPAEVDILIGDATKARTVLNWKREISFQGLVRKMVHNDVQTSPMVAKRKSFDRGEIPVLLVNTPRRNCGAYEYFLRLVKNINHDNIFDYAEVESLEEFHVALSKRPYAFVVLNYHNLLFPWWTPLSIPTFYIYHEGPMPFTDDPRMILDSDPTAPNGIPRPVFQSTASLPRVPNDIPTIGTFGFGFYEKRFDRVVKAVQESYDVARIRFSLPKCTYANEDENMSYTKALLDSCRMFIYKPGIQIEIQHEYLDDEALMRFLTSNDINMFMYEIQPGRGCSSVTDYLIGLDRPLAISDSNMFRHIYDDSICAVKTPLREMIDSPKAKAHIQSLRKKWAPDVLRETLISRILSYSQPA
jgi:GDPmannose 4,6-dehydratase